MRTAPPGACPAHAENAGAAARRYHARHGRVLPTIDPAAGSTAPKHHPGVPVLPLPFPPTFPSPCADHGRAAFPECLGALLALLNGITRVDWTAAGVGAGRPVPSGGGTYPAEVYTATASGLCHYLRRLTHSNSSPPPTCATTSPARWTARRSNNRNQSC